MAMSFLFLTTTQASADAVEQGRQIRDLRRQLAATSLALETEKAMHTQANVVKEAQYNMLEASRKELARLEQKNVEMITALGKMIEANMEGRDGRQEKERKEDGDVMKVHKEEEEGEGGGGKERGKERKRAEEGENKEIEKKVKVGEKGV